MKNNRRKGFTLLELIIVMAITVVILGVIYTFGAVSQRTLGNAEVKSTLQNEGDIIRKELLSIGTQGKDITFIDNSPSIRVAYDTVDATRTDAYKNSLGITKLTFRVYPVATTLSLMNTYTFEIRTDPTDNKKKLYLKNDTSGYEKVLSENVTQMRITPLDYQTVPSNKSLTHFDTASGLQITVEMHIKKGYSDVTYPVTTIVNFRNKDATTT